MGIGMHCDGVADPEDRVFVAQPSLISHVLPMCPSVCRATMQAATNRTAKGQRMRVGTRHDMREAKG